MKNIFLQKLIERLEANPELLNELPDDVKLAVENYGNEETGNINIPVPPSITPRQFRLALIQRGISLQQIEQVIDSLPEPDQTLSRVSWEYATSFDRTDTLLNQMAPAIELTQEDLDEIFINGQNM